MQGITDGCFQQHQPAPGETTARCTWPGALRACRRLPGCFASQCCVCWQTTSKLFQRHTRPWAAAASCCVGRAVRECTGGSSCVRHGWCRCWCCPCRPLPPKLHLMLMLRSEQGCLLSRRLLAGQAAPQPAGPAAAMRAGAVAVKTAVPVHRQTLQTAAPAPSTTSPREQEQGAPTTLLAPACTVGSNRPTYCHTAATTSTSFRCASAAILTPLCLTLCLCLHSPAPAESCAGPRRSSVERVGAFTGSS